MHTCIVYTYVLFHYHQKLYNMRKFREFKFVLEILRSSILYIVNITYTILHIIYYKFQLNLITYNEIINVMNKFIQFKINYKCNIINKAILLFSSLFSSTFTFIIIIIEQNTTLSDPIHTSLRALN